MKGSPIPMYETMIDTIGAVAAVDPELGAAMNRELHRQRQNIELIASENIVSPAVMAAMGSVLTNKYAEGLPGKRYYGGCVYVDEVENIAIQRACQLFGAKYANVQPHSGAQANLAVYFALLELGDTVMGMDLSQGGHLTHGSPVNMSGKTTTSSPTRRRRRRDRLRRAGKAGAQGAPQDAGGGRFCLPPRHRL